MYKSCSTSQASSRASLQRERNCFPTKTMSLTEQVSSRAGDQVKPACRRTCLAGNGGLGKAASRPRNVSNRPKAGRMMRPVVFRRDLESGGGITGRMMRPALGASEHTQPSRLPAKHVPAGRQAATQSRTASAITEHTVYLRSPAHLLACSRETALTARTSPTRFAPRSALSGLYCPVAGERFGFPHRGPEAQRTARDGGVL